MPGVSYAVQGRTFRRDMHCEELLGLLRFFRVVHAIPGRVRLRPLPGCIDIARTIGQRTVSLLQVAYEESEIRFSEMSGSVLMISSLHSFAVFAVENADSHHAKKLGLWEQLPQGEFLPASRGHAGVRNPIPGKARSFLYPRFFNYVFAVLRAIPYIVTGLKRLLRGSLTLDVLDGAALLVCLLQRDFRSLSSITFFFALGEFLAEWTRKKSRASLTESLALNIEQVWIRVDGVSASFRLRISSLGIMWWCARVLRCLWTAAWWRAKAWSTRPA